MRWGREVGARGSMAGARNQSMRSECLVIELICFSLFLSRALLSLTSSARCMLRKAGSGSAGSAFEARGAAHASPLAAALGSPIVSALMPSVQKNRLSAFCMMDGAAVEGVSTGASPSAVAAAVAGGHQLRVVDECAEADGVLGCDA